LIVQVGIQGGHDTRRQVRQLTIGHITLLTLRALVFSAMEVALAVEVGVEVAVEEVEMKMAARGVDDHALTTNLGTDHQRPAANLMKKLLGMEAAPLSVNTAKP
jgi:hypothetical protein